jgi:type II secretory pathway pseudopilin PulG
MHRDKFFRRPAAAGFTIVELMIATLVFSVILLVVTYGVISFTKNYYKGVNSSTTQNTARNVIDAVSQAIETGQSTLSTSSAASSGGTVDTYCFGNTQFDYILNSELGVATSDALVESPSSSSGGCATITSPGSNGQELLGPHLRLLKFDIQKVNGLAAASLPAYTITVQVAYGDNDQLCNSSATNDCTSSGNSTHLEDPGATDTCKPGTGSQFCDVTQLSTTVQMRIQPQ